MNSNLVSLPLIVVDGIGDGAHGGFAVGHALGHHHADALALGNDKELIDIYNGSITIGTQNELLTQLFSITPFN